MSRKSERARELRRDPSRAEKLCWELIRAHRMEGIKFRRQHPIGPYFADFACASKGLVIEIDGDQHADQVEADARRTAVMERLGWKVVRFGANEVVQNPEGIWAAIQLLISERALPPLLTSPPSGGEEHEGGIHEGGVSSEGARR
jgi:very-short-patch-repair endonuclease